MTENSNTGRSPPFGRLQRLPSGYDMHVRELGAGPTTVVFVHGSGPGVNAHSNFFPNYPALAAAGYRVILPDLIGYGYSSKPTGIDYTLDLFTTTLTELLDLADVRKCVLVGNSLGGAIALKIAMDQPERVTKLVLMGPGGIESREDYFKMPGIQKMVAGFVGEGFDRGGLRRLLELLSFDPKFVTDELVDERLSILRTQPKDVLARMKIPDLSPQLAQVRCPVLGFWGIEDQFCPASGHAKILRAVEDSRFVLYSRCGHWAMIERAGDFNRHVIDFLQH
jgi:4,5:9,10-diseco-3-hydroxy-5,9,17-trioxoandrosta-1(10),2-diene-4-oate hydrolase